MNFQWLKEKKLLYSFCFGLVWFYSNIFCCVHIIPKITLFSSVTQQYTLLQSLDWPFQHKAFSQDCHEVEKRNSSTHMLYTAYAGSNTASFHFRVGSKSGGPLAWAWEGRSPMHVKWVMKPLIHSSDFW